MHKGIKFILFWNDTLRVVKPTRCTIVSNVSSPQINTFDSLVHLNVFTIETVDVNLFRQAI